MKVKCYMCEKEAQGTEDQLVDKGWQGARGIFNSKHYDFAACPEHTMDFVKAFPDLLLKLK